MLKRLFTSYSHKDESFVFQIVRLLRITGSPVFKDGDSISPGKKWRTEISDAIRESDVVLVFWSINSITSAEVESEYKNAIQHGKDVVPVLMDQTPLADALKEYQFVDFSFLSETGGANYYNDEANYSQAMKVLVSQLRIRIFDVGSVQSLPS